MKKILRTIICYDCQATDTTSLLKVVGENTKITMCLCCTYTTIRSFKAVLVCLLSKGTPISIPCLASTEGLSMFERTRPTVACPFCRGTIEKMKSSEKREMSHHCIRED